MYIESERERESEKDSEMRERKREEHNISNLVHTVLEIPDEKRSYYL